MPESHYIPLDPGSGRSCYWWYTLTSLEKKLILLTGVLGIVVFSLSLALVCQRHDVPSNSTTPAPTSTSPTPVTTLTPSTKPNSPPTSAPTSTSKPTLPPTTTNATTATTPASSTTPSLPPSSTETPSTTSTKEPLTTPGTKPPPPKSSIPPSTKSGTEQNGNESKTGTSEYSKNIHKNLSQVRSENHKSSYTIITHQGSLAIVISAVGLLAILTITKYYLYSKPESREQRESFI